jgi:hypothetical protein
MKEEQCTRLGNIAAVFSGLAPYGRSPVKQGDFEMRLIGPKDLQDGSVVLHGIEAVTVQDLAKVAEYRVTANDLLLTLRGGNSKTAVCDPEVSGFYAGPNLAVIRLFPDSAIGPNLLQSILDSLPGQALLRTMSQGTSTLGIRPKSLLDLSISVPPPDTARQLEQLCLLMRETRRATRSALQQRERLVLTLAGKYLNNSGVQA